MMKREEMKEAIDRYIDAYNRFDIDAIMQILASDIRFENVSGGMVNAKASGKSEFEALARQSAQLFASRRQTVITIKTEGGWAFVEIEFEGILAQDLPDGSKAGKKILIKGTSEFVFVNGLVSSIIDRG